MPSRSQWLFRMLAHEPVISVAACGSKRAPHGRGASSRDQIYPQLWAAGRLRGGRKQGPRGGQQHTETALKGGWHRQGDEPAAAGVSIQHTRRTAARDRQLLIQYGQLVSPGLRRERSRPCLRHAQAEWTGMGAHDGAAVAGDQWRMGCARAALARQGITAVAAQAAGANGARLVVVRVSR